MPSKSVTTSGKPQWTVSGDPEDNEVKTRLRRTKSVAQAELATAVERKARIYQPDKPCHKTRDSIFSWSSGFNKYEGFVNWGALMLCLGGIRLFLENVLKYGIRISPQSIASWILHEDQNNSYIHTPIFVVVGCHVHFLFAFLLEKLMCKNFISSRLGSICQVIHLGLIIIFPVVLLSAWSTGFSLIGRTFICVVNTVIFLKVWSYAQVNHWCRKDHERLRKISRKRCSSFKMLNRLDSYDDDNSSPMQSQPDSPPLVQYPDNLTLGDLYYFLAAPTFCYELNFPRSHQIRPKFLFRRLIEVFILFNILLGLFQQWIIPSVENSLKPFSELEYVKCLERILKLAVPNHLLWLISFYLIFHSVLNTIGELLRFGDRDFYQDWWNSRNVGSFWRLWNLPVHKWCLRHVFVPMLRAKYSKFSASMAVFFLSAFFHEYWVSIPLQMYKVGVFLGMFFQFPLIYFSQWMENRFGFRAGNIIVWASLILGQPVGIMVYYHDYIIQNYNVTMTA